MTVEGIDISRWQYRTPPLGTSLEFVFVRATYGIFADYRYAQHAKDVRSAGKVLGAYHFGRNGDPDPQVKAFLSTIGPTVKLVALDLEKDGNNPRMSYSQATAWIKAVQATGRKVGLYHSESNFPHLGQDFNWVANWGDEPNIAWTFWQYAVTNGVDRDRFKGTVEQLEALAGIPTNWQWTCPRLSYVQYTGVNAEKHTYDGRHRAAAAPWVSKPYRCSAPQVFTGDHGPVRLVRVGSLVTGERGKYTHQWVSADNAKRVLV